MSFGDVVITGIFVGWFLLVLLRQLGLWHAFVRLPDIFQLIPRWRLFTGFAGHHDYSIQVRTIGSTPSDWQRFEEKPRTIVSALWHPASLPAQLRRNQITAVISEHRNKGETGLGRYRALINELSTMPEVRHAERFQFRVVAERPYDLAFEAREIYRSPVEFIRTC